MSTIIIVHGTGGSPESNWFPWLKSELEKLGHRVFVPRLPTPPSHKPQSLESWLHVFKEYEQCLDDDTIVVGHSLGPAFLLSVLEAVPRPIKAAFFVAGFVALLDNPRFDDLNRTFVTKTFDWAAIKKNCRNFVVINSDNDPYVPLQKGKDLAAKLSTELIVLKNAGHINTEAGYAEFPFLLEKIKENL